MGEGTPIHFRHARWIGDNTLKFLDPELYVCLADKDACISEVLWLPEGSTVRVWDLRFYREFQDCELAASYSLLQSLFNLVFPGVKEVILFIGVSKEMVSLTPCLSTMRFGVLRILCFLGSLEKKGS